MPQKIVLCDDSLKKLVKEIKKRECLWNLNHDRYNDRYQMAKAWKEIADLMELPEDRLRVKWKNLRDLFKKEIKRFGSPGKYTGKWRHFEMMKFINITDGPNKRISNGNDLNKTNGNDGGSVEAKEEIEDDEDFEYEELEEQEQEEEMDNNGVGVYLDDPYAEDPIPDKIAKLSDDEDYDVMFLKSLAPYFKQLDPIRKLVVRSKMQDMLLNEIGAQASATQLQAKKG